MVLDSSGWLRSLGFSAGGAHLSTLLSGDWVGFLKVGGGLRGPGICLRSCPVPPQASIQVLNTHLRFMHIIVSVEPERQWKRFPTVILTAPDPNFTAPSPHLGPQDETSC